MPYERKGKRIEWEEQFLGEVLARFYPGAHVYTKVRLGKVPIMIPPEGLDELTRKLWGNVRFWADAVVVGDKELVLIETKLKPTIGVISQMEIYRDQLTHTPEFSAYQDLPVRPELYYFIEYPLIVSIARQRGIRCIQFTPSFSGVFMAHLSPQERQAPVR